MRGIALRFRGVEAGTPLAWIGIDSQEQKLAGDRTKIDYAILQDLRRVVPVLEGHQVGGRRRCIRCNECQLNGFLDFAGYGVKRHYAVLLDGSGYDAAHTDTVLRKWRKIEHCSQPRQR